MDSHVVAAFMRPPPAATYLAFYPQDINITAIGMEDSTNRIYNAQRGEVVKVLILFCREA